MVESATRPHIRQRDVVHAQYPREMIRMTRGVTAVASQLEAVGDLGLAAVRAPILAHQWSRNAHELSQRSPGRSLEPDHVLDHRDARQPKTSQSKPLLDHQRQRKLRMMTIISMMMRKTRIEVSVDTQTTTMMMSKFKKLEKKFLLFFKLIFVFCQWNLFWMSFEREKEFITLKCFNKI